MEAERQQAGVTLSDATIEFLVKVIKACA
jgi:hypothetical protein